MMMMMMMMNMVKSTSVATMSKHPYETCFYKKDGYRQQNVRQRQKLMSIIDYDVCMTFY